VRLVKKLHNDVRVNKRQNQAKLGKFALTDTKNSRFPDK
jgi:hypothetical protein